MSSLYSNYMLFPKQRISLDQLASGIGSYDRLISAFNNSERVQRVFRDANAKSKHWLTFPEYGPLPNVPADAIQCPGASEDESIRTYLDNHPIQADEAVCVDVTGFVRPHILFLLRHLFHLGHRGIDLVYSEPVAYTEGAATKFSENVTEVRLVRGYEGSHTTDPEGEYLVVGCGYDVRLMSAVANHRLRARKIQVFPFPALRPHMYQESRLQTHACEVAFGPVLETLFAPAHDPFATAQILSEFYSQNRSEIKNLYLSPLATKPQVVGFALFYLTECIGEPVSILFPFSDRYNAETTIGISEVWKYHFDMDLIRELIAVGSERKSHEPK